MGATSRGCSLNVAGAEAWGLCTLGEAMLRKLTIPLTLGLLIGG